MKNVEFAKILKLGKWLTFGQKEGGDRVKLSKLKSWITKKFIKFSRLLIGVQIEHKLLKYRQVLVY